MSYYKEKNTSNIVLVDEPAYCQVLSPSPSEREAFLNEGVWLVMGYAMWSMPDIRAIRTGLDAAIAFGGTIRFGIRPFNDFYEFDSWLPHQNTTNSPVWGIIKNGQVEAIRTRLWKRRELEDLVRRSVQGGVHSPETTGALKASRQNRRLMVWFKLRWAGWRPGRDVWESLRTPHSLLVFPEARRVLSEYGGLQFLSSSGYTRLDPVVGEEIANEIKAYEKLVGRPLYPLGIIEGGDTLYVLIDDRGVIYTLAGRLEPLASSFERAIPFLVNVTAVKQGSLDNDLRSIGMLEKFWEIEASP